MPQSSSMTAVTCTGPIEFQTRDFPHIPSPSKTCLNYIHTGYLNRQPFESQLRHQPSYHVLFTTLSHQRWAEKHLSLCHVHMSAHVCYLPR